MEVDIGSEIIRARKGHEQSIEFGSYTSPLNPKKVGSLVIYGPRALAEARRVYRDISSDVTAKTDEDIRGKVIPFKTGAEIELVMKEYDR